jgi:hypothetical protein
MVAAAIAMNARGEISPNPPRRVMSQRMAPGRRVLQYLRLVGAILAEKLGPIEALNEGG